MSMPLLRPNLPLQALRLQVCPPSPHRSLPAWWPLWLVALKRALPCSPPRGADRLALARDDFLAVIADLRGEPLDILRVRIRHARSMRDLWHLRAALFGLLCTRLSEACATERLALLNRHFPTRAPRSGFAPLEGPSR